MEETEKKSFQTKPYFVLVVYITTNQVQEHLQMRIDAQGKYMHTILEKAAAAHTLSEENTNPHFCHKYFGIQQYGNMGIMKNPEFDSQVNFPSLEELQCSIPVSETAYMEKTEEEDKY